MIKPLSKRLLDSPECPAFVLAGLALMAGFLGDSDATKQGVR